LDAAHALYNRLHKQIVEYTTAINGTSNAVDPVAQRAVRQAKSVITQPAARPAARPINLNDEEVEF
jgi:hypothetical protein